MSAVSAGDIKHPTTSITKSPYPQNNKSIQADIKVALLTGGIDRPYVFGLSMALASRGLILDIIGSDEVDRPELHSPPCLNFLNLRGSMDPTATIQQKMVRVLIYYGRLIRYAMTAQPKVFHVLWENKFQHLDRTLILLYYRVLGKKVSLTAMNVNARRRDAQDSKFNRLTLRIQYHLVHHIFVHTEKMKRELLEQFGVRKEGVTIIPMGVNHSVPNTELTTAEAKQRLGITQSERTILFFGTIRPYKGLEYLVAAFHLLAPQPNAYRLVIVGDPMQSGKYWEDIRQAIENHPTRDRVIQRIQYIPDSETELYFKAADVNVLPYVDIFQSGVLVLSYGFGLPVIATDVGSLREDVVEGKTGLVCNPRDPIDLARAIHNYFESDLYKHLGQHRSEISNYTSQTNSWDVAAEKTAEIYDELVGRSR